MIQVETSVPVVEISSVSVGSLHAAPSSERPETTIGKAQLAIRSASVFPQIERRLLT
jgi:hypothetical protein